MVFGSEVALFGFWEYMFGILLPVLNETAFAIPLSE
jgi:hypothetical protein